MVHIYLRLVEWAVYSCVLLHDFSCMQVAATLSCVVTPDQVLIDPGFFSLSGSLSLSFLSPALCIISHDGIIFEADLVHESASTHVTMAI